MDYNRYCHITKPANIKELIEYNKFLLGGTTNAHAKWNMLNPMYFLTDFESEQSKLAVERNITPYSLEDFTYTFNNIGYRSSSVAYHNHHESMVAFYGCSVTLGVGVPEEHTFVHLFKKMTGLNAANFGINGAGINKVMKAFVSSTSFMNIGKAIFMFPSVHRFELFYQAYGRLGVHDLAPSNYLPENVHSKHYKQHNDRIKSLYGLFIDEQFADEFVRNLEIIVTRCMVKNIPCYFTSWCPYAYQILCEYIDRSMILDFIDLRGVAATAKDRAIGRDGAHPGLHTHETVALILASRFKG